jgi:Zn-dependent protease with chaperone function
MFLLGILALVAAAILGLVTGRSQAAPPPRWQGFVYWAVAGFLAAGALLSLMSIGLLLLPFATVALFLTARRFPIGADAIGLVAGFGLVAMGIGLRNLGNHRCPSRPFLFAPGQVGAMECGGPSPIPWLLGGLACLVFAVGISFWLTRHTRPRASGNMSR